MRPRYDVLRGGLMLALSGVLLVVFGVPSPSPWAASIALFVAGGLLGVAAGFRPERYDLATLRGPVEALGRSSDGPTAGPGSSSRRRAVEGGSVSVGTPPLPSPARRVSARMGMSV